VPSGPDGLTDTLAPVLHWRVCHVWEWLYHWAPTVEYGDWSTRTLAEAYGGRDGEEALEIHARTGCVCCPLASRDTALDAILRLPRWQYLLPLKRIRKLYESLRLPHNRLRKHGETLKDGRPSSSPYRMGPITLEARRWGLETLLGIQAEVNAEADRLRRPKVDHLNDEEEARIRELITAQTWPNGWTGTEPRADKPYEDGSPHLFDIFGES
jgi:DNA sulfur modification protein DndC